MAEAEPVLQVQGVQVRFRGKRGRPVLAVNDVSFSLDEGKTLGLIGESGSGKTTTGRSIAGLLPIDAGTIRFRGAPLPASRQRHERGRPSPVQMIFQDPSSALDPRKTVWESVVEPITLHRRMSDADSDEVLDLVDRVGLSADQLGRYPHELSGGQKQRVSIARTLLARPALIVCDEPTSALDVSIQADIIGLLAELQDQHRAAYLVISHDLAVVANLADEIAVMYLGRIVEMGAAADVVERPVHPYTRSLIAAHPDPWTSPDAATGVRISGEPPDPAAPPTGCPFHPRCPYAEPACMEGVPPAASVTASHWAACIRIPELPEFQISHQTMRGHS